MKISDNEIQNDVGHVGIFPMWTKYGNEWNGNWLTLAQNEGWKRFR